jgi:hypothetical protein
MLHFSDEIHTVAASFHKEGKIPFVKLRLNMYFKRRANISAQPSIISLLLVSQLTDLDDLSSNCSFNVSIGNERNITNLRIGSLRIVGI